MRNSDSYYDISLYELSRNVSIGTSVLPVHISVNPWIYHANSDWVLTHIEFLSKQRNIQHNCDAWSQKASPCGEERTLPVLHSWTDGVEPKLGDRIEWHLSEGLIEASRRAAETARPGTLPGTTTWRRHKDRSLLPLRHPSSRDCRRHFHKRHKNSKNIPCGNRWERSSGSQHGEVLLTRGNHFTQCVSLFSSLRRRVQNTGT
jgi:hypothetical protein